MSPRSGRTRASLLLPLALGVSDGILTALILAGATVLRGSGLTMSLALRVGAVAFVSVVFTVFVAEYSQYRSELAGAERQLNFTTSGRLATTHLGRAVLRDAMIGALVASAASFVGAVFPLAMGAVLPRASWVALVVALAALGGLGIVLASSVGGRRFFWAASLIVAGSAVLVIGVQLDIA